MSFLQLKAEYRDKYECLQVMNAECTYCKQYVDQSRHKLLSEFEAWYRLAFLGGMDLQQGEGLTTNGVEKQVNLNQYVITLLTMSLVYCGDKVVYH